MERRQRIETGLDRATSGGIEELDLDAELLERLNSGLRLRQLALAAQQHEQSLTALEVEVQPLRQLVQSIAAEVGEAMHAGAIGAVDRRATGAPPSPQPG